MFKFDSVISKLALAAAFVAGFVSTSTFAGEKSIVKAEAGYWERFYDIQAKRDDNYEVGISVSCNDSYTVDWVKVKVRPLNSSQDRETYDTFNQNLSCPVLQDEKWYLMQYTYAELVEFAGSTDSEGVSIKLVLKAIGGGRTNYKELRVYKDINGNVVIQNNNHLSVTHTEGLPVTAYFASSGLASSEVLLFIDITNEQ